MALDGELAFAEPAHDAGIRWSDPDIGVEWPVAQPILSPKDANQVYLKDVEDRLRADYETAEEANV